MDLESDGTPILGSPLLARDYSELSFELAEPMPFPVRSAIQKVVDQWMPDGMDHWIPQARWQWVGSEPRFPGDSPVEGHWLTISRRAQSALDRHQYYSAAPLDTARHRQFLTAWWMAAKALSQE